MNPFSHTGLSISDSLKSVRKSVLIYETIIIPIWIITFYAFLMALKADELYVDGDIIDRGRGGIKILKYMMMQPNIYPIIGNHEYALMQVLDFVTQEITEDAISKIDEKTLKNIVH